MITKRLCLLMIILFPNFSVELFFFVIQNIEELKRFFLNLLLSSPSIGFAKYCFLNIKNFRPTWGSNPRPWEEEFHALTTDLAGLYDDN